MAVLDAFFRGLFWCLAAWTLAKLYCSLEHTGPCATATGTHANWLNGESPGEHSAGYQAKPWKFPNQVQESPGADPIPSGCRVSLYWSSPTSPRSSRAKLASWVRVLLTHKLPHLAR